MTTNPYLDIDINEATFIATYLSKKPKVLDHSQRKRPYILRRAKSFNYDYKSCDSGSFAAEAQRKLLRKFEYYLACKKELEEEEESLDEEDVQAVLSNEEDEEETDDEDYLEVDQSDESEEIITYQDDSKTEDEGEETTNPDDHSKKTSPEDVSNTIYNVNPFPITSVEENGEMVVNIYNAYRDLQQPEPYTQRKRSPIEVQLPQPDTFDEVQLMIHKCISVNESEDEESDRTINFKDSKVTMITTLPMLVNQSFNPCYTTPSINKLIIFGDFETYNFNGSHKIPITCFLYCLNTGESVYVKMKPSDSDQKNYDCRGQGTHKISKETINLYHKLSPREGMELLVQWMSMLYEKNNCEGNILFYAHNAQFERAIFDRYKRWSKDLKKWYNMLEFVCTYNQILRRLKFHNEPTNNESPVMTPSSTYRPILYNNDSTINPPFYKLTGTIDDRVHRGRRRVLLNLSAIADRLGFGLETHNAIDDTFFVVGALCYTFSCITPLQLASKLLEHYTPSTSVLKNIGTKRTSLSFSYRLSEKKRKPNRSRTAST